MAWEAIAARDVRCKGLEWSWSDARLSTCGNRNLFDQHCGCSRAYLARLAMKPCMPNMFSTRVKL